MSMLICLAKVLASQTPHTDRHLLAVSCNGARQPRFTKPHRKHAGDVPAAFAEEMFHDGSDVLGLRQAAQRAKGQRFVGGRRRPRTMKPGADRVVTPGLPTSWAKANYPQVRD